MAILDALDANALRLVLAIIQGLIALNFTACSFLNGPKRTYYPLLRFIFIALTFVYGQATVAQYWSQGSDATVLRQIISSGVVLALSVGAVVFMAYSNRHPVWVRRDFTGNEEVDFATIDENVGVTLSIFRHGVASPELAGQLRNALAEWDRREGWKRATRAELDARRAAKGADYGR